MMTVTDEERDQVAALVPQSLRRQLVARGLCLALGFGAARAAKDIAAYGAELTKMAFGSPSDVPAIAWPREWRRAKHAVAQAETVVEVSPEWYGETPADEAESGAYSVLPRGEEDDEGHEAGITTETVWVRECARRYLATDGAWHTCRQAYSADGKLHFHRHGEGKLLEDGETWVLRELDHQAGRLGVEPVEVPEEPAAEE